MTRHHAPRRSSRTTRRCLRGRMDRRAGAVFCAPARGAPGTARAGCPGSRATGRSRCAQRRGACAAPLMRDRRRWYRPGPCQRHSPPQAVGHACSPAQPAQRRPRADPVRGHGRTPRTWPVPTGRPAHRSPRRHAGRRRSPGTRRPRSGAPAAGSPRPPPGRDDVPDRRPVRRPRHRPVVVGAVCRAR